MEYFNSKEEVLEVVLTPFGRYKLGLGGFDVAYYSFFDEGILYDSRWASGSAATTAGPGVTTGEGIAALEVQNLIEPRIQEETPYAHPPTAFHGVGSTIEFQNLAIRKMIYNKYGTSDPPFVIQDPVNGIKKIYNQELTQMHGDKFDFLSDPIGTSTLSSDKYPSWYVGMLKGQITSSTNFLSTERESANPFITDGPRYQQIPQLNITLNYKVYADKLNDPTLIENSQYLDYSNITFPIPSLVSPYSVTGELEPDEFANAASEIFGDGTFFAIENGKIILDCLENNTDFKKENFEIQIFLSGSQFNDMYGNPKQLYFTDRTDEGFKDDEVEKYLSIHVDREISSVDLQRAPFEDLTAFETAASVGSVVSTRDFIIRDLYNPDEDICT